MFVSHAHVVGQRHRMRITSHVQETFQYYKNSIFERLEWAADSKDISPNDGTTRS